MFLPPLSNLYVIAASPPELLAHWQRLIFTCPTILSFVMFLLFFHTSGLLFHLFDQYHLFPKYKIFRAGPRTPSYRAMLPTVFFNQLFLLFPLMLLFTRLGWAYNRARDAPHGLVAQVFSYLACATIAPFVHEVLFYTAHRYLLHSRWGFLNLNHALHHSTRAHSSISAMYMSPVDFVLEVVLPYLVPLAVLTRFHLLTRTHAVLMLPIGALGGLYEHSGYNFFPAVDFLDTRTHGLHHIYHNCSFADGFGSTNLFDPFFKSACVNVVPAAAAAVRAACTAVSTPSEKVADSSRADRALDADHVLLPGAVRPSGGALKVH